MRLYLLIIILYKAAVLCAQSPTLVLPIGHTNTIHSAMYSPNGNYIVTAGWDKTAKVWNTNGDLLKEIIHPVGVSFASYSHTGKYIVTGADDGKVRIWDAIDGHLIRVLVGHSKVNKTVMYSPDDKYIVSASWDETAKIWDAETGELLFTLRGHDGWLHSAMYSADSKLIVTASEDNTAMVWNSSNGNFVTALKAHTGCVKSAEFSHDNKFVLTASEDSTAIVWNIATGKIVQKIRDSARLASACYTNDGKHIMTVSQFDKIKIWNAIDGKLLQELTDGDEGINFAVYSPNDKNILFISSSPTIWSLLYHKPISILQGHIPNITSIGFSPTEKYFVTAEYNHINFWNTDVWKMSNRISGNYGWINSIDYSLDGKYLLAGCDDSTGKIFNTSTGRIEKIFKDSGQIRQATFSPSMQYVLTASHSGNTKLWNRTNGNLIKEFKSGSDFGGTEAASFSPNEKNIITVSGNTLDSAKIWDVNTGKLVYKLQGFYANGGYAVYSPDGNSIVTASMNNKAEVWDAVNGTLKYQLEGHTASLLTANYNSDGKKIITTSNDGTARIWDTSGSSQPVILKGHTSIVSRAKYTPDGKNIYTTSFDKTIKIWNASSGKFVADFCPIDSIDYVIKDSSGYYMCTPNAAKLFHYVTKDLKLITFKQLDIKYNRPDIILQELGNVDTALIKSYRKAYEKRIQKLRIDTTSFKNEYALPEADFVNRNIIESQQSRPYISLQIRAIDSTSKIERFNLWVNDVPNYGQRGIRLKGQNKNTFDTTIIVNLSEGENLIETSVTNSNGTESYRVPLVINYQPATNKKHVTHFIGIGMDRFSDTKYNLQYSAKDIRDLSVKLKEKYGSQIIIDTLFNENVTVHNVKKLKKKLLETSVDDKVIIAYSGHGLLSKDYDYFLSTYSINFKTPEVNGLSYDDLENLLDSIPARKKIMLIDACHSGEVDKDEMLAMNKSAASMGLKGVVIDNEVSQSNPLGLKNSFELMENLFVNVRKNTGATIISAAAGNQYAIESGELKNGVFTYALLDALKKYPLIKVSELKKLIFEKVYMLTNGLQHPTYRSENTGIDWKL